jgi:hypothetical protein
MWFSRPARSYSFICELKFTLPKGAMTLSIMGLFSTNVIMLGVVAPLQNEAIFTGRGLFQHGLVSLGDIFFVLVNIIKLFFFITKWQNRPVLVPAACIISTLRVRNVRISYKAMNLCPTIYKTLSYREIAQLLGQPFSLSLNIFFTQGQRLSQCGKFHVLPIKSGTRSRRKYWAYLTRLESLARNKQ